MKTHFISAVWIGLGISLMGCSSRTLDYTTATQSATCELHRRQMTTMAVPLLTGTGLSRPTAEETASERLFPHSDAVVRTGYCIPVRETRVRIYSLVSSIGHTRSLKKGPD